MSRFDDETLMRRLDGEVDAETAREVDAAAGSDADLAVRLEALGRTGVALRSAFRASVDPRDVALTRLIAGAGTKASRRFDWRIWLTPSAVGLGAGLAVAGFVAGVLIAPLAGDRSTGFVDGGGRLANAGLVRVLDRRLAVEGPDASGRAVGLTFEATDGRWCRTFSDKDAGLAGLACRAGDGWAVQALAPVETTGEELRMAATDVPASVLAAVDALLASDTVSGEDEAKARDAGFR